MVRNQKEQRYKEVIFKATTTLWQRMSELMDTVPDGMNYEDMTPEQQEILEIVDAIEHEWIIKDEIREELSLINWEDDEDDDDA